MVHKDAGHDSRIQLAGNRDPVRLDSQIAAVERWIPTAATALLDFYDDGVFAEGGARFWRSNIERRQAQNSSDVNQRRKAKGATSTTRSLFALLLLVRLLEQEPELRETLWTAPASDRLKQVLTHAATHYFPQALVDLRTNSENYENRFTDAHILSAFALLLQSPALSDCLFPEQRIQISEEACGLARPIRAQVEANGGAALRTDERVHDFVTLHALRSLNLHQLGCRDCEMPPDIASKLAERIARQVGLNDARASSFDPGELAFGAASLASMAHAPDTKRLIARALEILQREQSEDGVWRGARLLYSGFRQLFYVASVEIGLSVVNLLDSDPTLGSHTDRALAILERTFGWVVESYRPYAIEAPHGGWANDQSSWPDSIESWTTAIVLVFLILYRHALLVLRGRDALDRLKVQSSLKPAWRWTEIDLLTPRTHEPEVFAYLSDPSDGGEIVRLFESEIHTPVVVHPGWRPPPDGVSTVLLYGPPGTRKTSFVKHVASHLRWPRVVLTPASFLGEGGIEGFESRADAVFSDLMRLRRCVVHLDECEELLRRRQRAASLGERTAGAFITSGMLPRVESIHDNRWCLFFVTTNTWLEELDPAITREGRFDRKQLFFHPRPPGQLRYARARVASRLLATGASDAARAHAAKLLGQVLDRQYLADRQPWEELAETLKKLKDAEDTTAAINAADAASDRRWVTFGDLDWLAKQIADTTAALPDAEAEPESMTRLVNEIDSKLQDRLKIESRNVWFEFETPVRRPT